MKFLNDINLLDLAPKILVNDENSKYILEAISYAILKQYKENIKKFDLIHRIPTLNDKEIDELLIQFHVDYVDETLTLQQKRSLVLNSIQTHLIKGTPRAVENICNILFEYSEVKEWFEYGGEPYHFRVQTIAGDIKDLADYNKIVEAIYQYKNTRSWLDGLRFLRKEETNLYYGSYKKYKIKYELGSTDVSIPNEEINNNFGTLHRSRYLINVK